MSMSANFTINGRFLTQKTTGVQRYAANVVKALDAALGQASSRAVAVAPSSASSVAFDLGHIHLETPGFLSGHAWEQVVLPFHCKGPLLNLCNTAPVIKSEQIVCIHDSNVFSSPASYNPLFRLLYQTVQPQLVKRSARIVTVSHAAARQIARHLPIRLQDIAVLPNGHEHAVSWDPACAEIAPSFIFEARPDAARPFVLAIGSRAHHKNLGMLVSIAEELDAIGTDLVFAGGGSDIFTPGTLADRNNVYSIGRVTDDDLAYLIDRALCLAFPSLTEGFGLPIVEAMARGCPVISANSASMPEVCGRAALMAGPSDASAWVDHIRALRTSPQLAADLIGLGREQAQLFSWKNTSEGYLELLERFSSSPGAYKAQEPANPRIAVAFATRGRPNIVSQTVRHLLATQSLKPVTVVISCVDLADAGDLVNHPEVKIVTGPPGLAAQRNTALSSIKQEADVIAFFDDDFVADENWLRAAMEVFSDESAVVAFTGAVVADGIKGPGIAFEEARRIVAATPKNDTTRWEEPYSPYGCNMAFRISAIGELKFDERLVLYGWLEDRDFGAALARSGGRLVKSSDAFGVHMGVKSGRVSGERLGYSQIINPLYMMRKETMTLAQVAGQIFRNMTSNFCRLAWPEPYIDRRGRVRGNLIGIADALRGRLQPERAAELSMSTSARAIVPEFKQR